MNRRRRFKAKKNRKLKRFKTITIRNFSDWSSLMEYLGIGE